MPYVKYGKIDLIKNDQNTGKNVAYLEVNSLSLSAMKIKMHQIARGSFLSVVKLHASVEDNTAAKGNQGTGTALSSNQQSFVVDFTNQINPLFSSLTQINFLMVMDKKKKWTPSYSTASVIL